MRRPETALITRVNPADKTAKSLMISCARGRILISKRKGCFGVMFRAQALERHTAWRTLGIRLNCLSPILQGHTTRYKNG